MGNTPIHTACIHDHYEVVSCFSKLCDKELVQNNCLHSPLVSCFENGKTNYDSLETLLDEGWNPNYIPRNPLPQMRHKTQLSALYHAVMSNDMD